MPTNPRVAKAFKAMKEFGIPEEKVKPVLKNLLKLYEKNWELIEAENYRCLVDAIFQHEEEQVAEPKKKRRLPDQEVTEEAEGRGEPERPLKRLRLRYPENRVSTSPSCSRPRLDVNPKPLKVQGVENSHALIKPKEEPVTYGLPQFEVPVAVVPPGGNGLPREAEVLEGLRYDPVNEEGRSDGAPSSSCGRGTNSESANIVDGSSSTLEIFSSRCGEVKISLSCKFHNRRPNFRMPGLNNVIRAVEDKCLQAYKGLEPSFSVMKLMKDICECALELGTQYGKDSIETAVAVPSDDSPSRPSALGGVSAIEEPMRPKASDNQHAAPVVQSEIVSLPSSSNGTSHSSQVIIDFAGYNCGIDKEKDQNGNENENSHSLVVVEKDRIGSEIANFQSLVVAEHHDLMPLGTSSEIHDVNDIAKGQESVIISSINEVNNAFLPHFQYIPTNAISHSAYINFSLAQIGDSCCSTCSGNCILSLKPCACAQATGGVFAYTFEGLVREEFLDDWIMMSRDSRKQSLFYCQDCPLETSKNEDAKESCKGHLARKFIKECWWKCGCSRQCGNRVVQRGINCNLQVFMTLIGKGWGLRTLEELPKGAFVCEYVGEILTNKEFYARISQSSSTGTHEFPVLLDADWKGRVLKDEEALCLDGVYYGNIARFINHRCFDANLLGIPVEVETPERHYYRFAFFTTRKVEALEELTWDYGIDFDDHDSRFKMFECLCGSKFCRNLKRFTRSRSTKRREAGGCLT